MTAPPTPPSNPDLVDVAYYLLGECRPEYLSSTRSKKQESVARAFMHAASTGNMQELSALAYVIGGSPFCCAMGLDRR